MSARVDVAGVSVATGHFIDNERVDSVKTFDDRSPLDWSVKLADVSRGGAHEVDLALAAAVRAFPAWAALGPHGRATYLRRLADLIDERCRRDRPRRMSRHGDARRVASPSGHQARRAQLPCLRRSRRVLRASPLGVQRHPQHGAAHARGTNGRDHPVERALHALHVEVRPRARGRQHRYLEARRVVAAQRVTPHGPGRRG